MAHGCQIQIPLSVPLMFAMPPSGLGMSESQTMTLISGGHAFGNTQLALWESGPISDRTVLDSLARSLWSGQGRGHIQSTTTLPR